jgi:hypothetical protein
MFARFTSTLATLALAAQGAFAGASGIASVDASVNVSADAIAAAFTVRTEPYLAAARGRTLDALRERRIELPADFLAWVDKTPVVRTTVYGCRKDPLPVLLALRSLEIDLGEDTVRRDYTQLALAFALQDSYAARGAQGTGWNDADGAKAPEALPDVSPRPRLELVVPSDPRTPVDTKSTARALDKFDHIINFLEDHAPIEVETEVKELPPLEYDDKGIAKPQGKAVTVKKMVARPLYGADVIASAALQAEFNAYMAAHGFADVSIDCGDKVVFWKATEMVNDPGQKKRIADAHNLFHDAYRAKGRMPAERDRAPTASESMAWFIRNDRWAFSDADRAARGWPRFPLNAPWPVLMMLAADDQPLREREEIWARFRDSGEFRTYGEYIGGIAQQFDMQSARRVAPLAFNYGSIQMMWKDGGVCGTMGNIGARTHRIVGTPAATAGQPGHCALVVMGYDAKTKQYRCFGEQYATGGDEVTHVHAGWNYDDAGGRRHMIWHQTVAWGVNDDFDAFIDTLAMRRVWDTMPADEQARECVKLVDQGLARNPFAITLVDAALNAAPDTKTTLAVLEAFNRRADEIAKDKQYALYLTTVRDLAHARIERLPAPATQDETAKLLETLERQGCTNAALLARCWRALGGDDEFVARCKSSVEAYLASPDRTKDRRAAQKFASQVRELAKQVKGPAKRRWAEQMLGYFKDNENITIRGKTIVDPAVEELRKLAAVKPAAK